MKHILTTLLLAFAFTASGQNTNLQQKYNLPVFASQALSKTYTTTTAASGKYPGFVTWMKWKGATDAEILSVNEVAAAWDNEVWATDGYVAGNVNSAYPQNGCQSRANIDASGIFYAKTNIPLILAFGTYTGGGTGNYTETTTANGGPGSTGGTCIAIDHSTWLKRIFPDRNAMQSASWGDESFNGYSESFTVRGFRLEGGMDNKVHDSSFQSSGIAIWDSGETSTVEKCFASNFNDAGFHNVRGTPSIFYACSAFSNRRYGFWLDGSSLATIVLIGPSGDDNGFGDGTPGALIGGGPGYGREGGGTLSIISAKNESDNVAGRMKGKQRFLDLTGAWNVAVNGVQVYTATPLQEAIAIDWQGFNGSLDVRGMNLINYTNFAKLTSNGKVRAIKSPGNYTPFSAVTNESGFLWASRDLGQGTITPPVDPGPIDPGPVDPPPTGSSSYTGGPFTVNTSTFYVPVNVSKVTKAVFTFKPTSLAYGRILGTGPSLPSLQLYPNGYMYYAGQSVSDIRAVVGKTQTITATLPSINVTGLFQTDASQGGAQQGQFDKVELMGSTATVPPVVVPPVTPPPVTHPTGMVRKIKGINCANGEQFAVAKGFQTAVDALHVTLMRWPGGTVANTYHNADLSTMVSISKASKVDVLWVANVNDGTTAELLAALAAFKSAGVNVVGIELGNECYLKKWQDAFPTVQDYITKCKTFISALDASPYADIPVGIVAAPSADMKDPDSNGTGTDRLNSWNPAVLNAGIGDAVIVHAYASTATVANFLGYASDHFNYVSTISKKPVWVTEYNLLGAEQSPAQSAFIGDMLTMMRNDPNVQFACVHNLAAAGSNNNAITITGSAKKPVAVLTPMGLQLGKE